MNITYTNTINIEDYMALRKAVNWPAIVSEQAQSGLDGSRFVLVAYDGEKAVGIGRVVSDGGYVCYIV
jgi:hypothetical protein